MTMTIDEIARQAADEVLYDIGTRMDATAGLERIRTEAAFDAGKASRRVSIRRWIVLASAAAVIIAVTTAIVASGDDVQHRVSSVPVGPSLEPTSSAVEWPTTSASPRATNDVPPTGATSAETPSTETVSTDGETFSTIAVSYISVEIDRSLPVLAPMPFASVQLAPTTPPPGEAPPETEIAVTADGGAIVFDPVAQSASIIDAAGRSIDSIDIGFSLSSIVAGPGNVLYGLRQGSGIQLDMVAVALTGPKRGIVLENAPVPAVTYSELPIGAFGLGPTGIVDRVRDVGRQVIGYVDEHGDPTTMDGTATVTIDSSNVVRRDGGATWNLQIVRDPQWAGPETGPSPAAPSSNGGATYWTGLQTASPAGANSSLPTPAIDVAVALYADESGQAWILPAGWRVAASDVWGTLLAHETTDGIQLARFPSDADQHPDSSGLTSADLTADFARPCTVPKGTTIPGPIEGSRLTIIQTASASFPIVGTVEVTADGSSTTATQPDAIIGPTSISATGDVIAATIDRNGPDEVDVSADHGTTWKAVATVDDAHSVALSPDGSTIAVSNGSTLTLYQIASATPDQLSLPDVGGAIIDSLAYAGGGVIVAAVSTPVAGVSSEFAAKSDLFELAIETKVWNRITDLPADATHSAIVATPVGHSDSAFYLVKGVDPAISQLWLVGPSNQGLPVQVGNQLPANALLVGADAYGTNYTFAMNDVDGHYHLLTIGASGFVVHDLGCLRPLGATDLNHDPDRQ
jgi:hypothetical protein